MVDQPIPTDPGTAHGDEMTVPAAHNCDQIAGVLDLVGVLGSGSLDFVAAVGNGDGSGHDVPFCGLGCHGGQCPFSEKEKAATGGILAPDRRRPLISCYAAGVRMFVDRHDFDAEVFVTTRCFALLRNFAPIVFLHRFTLFDIPSSEPRSARPSICRWSWLRDRFPQDANVNLVMHLNNANVRISGIEIIGATSGSDASRRSAIRTVTTSSK
jgi:hypothetical protein